MDLDEFEKQYRVLLESNLNQLQSVNLLITKLKLVVNSISQDLHNLTLSFAEYVSQQEDESNN